MKIAVFHNFLDNIGGAEIVALTLARGFTADIYTTNIDADKIIKMGFEDVLPRIFSIGRIPKQAPFRHQLAFWKFRRLNLSGKYDFFIIAGDWAMSGAVNNHPNLWYIHSPLNELWEFRDYIREEILSPWKRPLYDIFVWLNRRLSLKYAKSVDNFTCNSINTKERTQKYYSVSAEIINPPVDVGRYHYESDGDYWLSVNRLITHKRIEIQMQTFAKLPEERLVIVGSYEKGTKQFESYRNYIESIKPKNVEIRNWVGERELLNLYANCRGFITTAKDEDFGMTVVEAMASGKPVIAPDEGGYKESVIKGAGILIDNINTEKLSEAIKSVKTPIRENTISIRRAKDFDKSIFIDKIGRIIQKYE